MKVILEIRPGEGGEDAKLLVQTQAGIYIKYSQNNALNTTVLNEDHG